jgi:hypothetical protein
MVSAYEVFKYSFLSAFTDSFSRYHHKKTPPITTVEGIFDGDFQTITDGIAGMV